MGEVLKRQQLMLRYLLEMAVNFSLIVLLYEFNLKILRGQSVEIFYFSGLISGIIFWVISSRLHIYFEKLSGGMIKV